ncbi:MAG: HAD family phosphatase [Verrucomicrobiota bacterium]|nr:HAD family phosphatase [Verrucomicrobiota bacterium]
MKGVFFDLGNVLVFFSYSKMLTQVARCTGLSLEHVQQLLEQQKLRDLYEEGTLSSAQLYRNFSVVSEVPFTPAELFQAASDIFLPNEPIIPIVQRLKEKNIPLLLLSNTNPAHFDFLSERYTFLNLFDHKILSYQVGAIKPNPAIYQAALKAVGASPSECFYTDDIPQFVEAARQLGIDAEQYTDIATLKTHLSNRNLL